MNKAVILAGGKGTRLKLLTNIICKQLLPVYNKPMIYCPISLCMMADIKEIALIIDKNQYSSFNNLLGDGGRFGVNITYIFQNYPNGIPEGIHLAKDFVGNDKFLFLLGDNITIGHDLPKKIFSALQNEGATIFSYFIPNPKSFGVLEFDAKGTILSIEEKPDIPKSNWVSIGIYIFDKNATKYFQNIKKSSRGEYEMPDILNLYIKSESLKIEKLGRGYTWFDTGTIKSLFYASNTIKIIEDTSNQLIGSIEDIAYRKGWIGEK